MNTDILKIVTKERKQGAPDDVKEEVIWPLNYVALKCDDNSGFHYDSVVFDLWPPDKIKHDFFSGLAIFSKPYIKAEDSSLLFWMSL
jgi:hypothetical protein